MLTHREMLEEVTPVNIAINHRILRLYLLPNIQTSSDSLEAYIVAAVFVLMN